MTSQALGGGEFTLWLVPRQKVAPLYWRSDTQTHIDKTGDGHIILCFYANGQD